jgi:hypothetical protein
LFHLKVKKNPGIIKNVPQDIRADLLIDIILKTNKNKLRRRMLKKTLVFTAAFSVIAMILIFTVLPRLIDM